MYYIITNCQAVFCEIPIFLPLKVSPPGESYTDFLIGLSKEVR